MKKEPLTELEPSTFSSAQPNIQHTRHSFENKFNSYLIRCIKRHLDPDVLIFIHDMYKIPVSLKLTIKCIFSYLLIYI